jgi:hypothetical protein
MDILRGVPDNIIPQIDKENVCFLRGQKIALRETFEVYQVYA